MDTEEAIEIIRETFNVTESIYGHSEEADEACNMAIKALKNCQST